MNQELEWRNALEKMIIRKNIRQKYLKTVKNSIEILYIIINFSISGVTCYSNNFSWKEVGIISDMAFPSRIKAPNQKQLDNNERCQCYLVWDVYADRR